MAEAMSKVVAEALEELYFFQVNLYVLLLPMLSFLALVEPIVVALLLEVEMEMFQV